MPDQILDRFFHHQCGIPVAEVQTSFLEQWISGSKKQGQATFFTGYSYLNTLMSFKDLTRRAHTKALYDLGALKFSLYVLRLVGASFFMSIHEAKKWFKLSFPCSSDEHITKYSWF